MATAADLMTTAVPFVRPELTVAGTMSVLRAQAWAEVGHVYLVDDKARLVGQVPMEHLLSADPEQRLSELYGDPPVEVLAGDKAETVALRAVEHHDADVAVVDEKHTLLGAIPIGRLLTLLHEEHVDDILRMGGIVKMHPLPIKPGNPVHAFRARMPWLVMGLAGGFLAGGIAGLFETSLKQEIALAFFLPLVVYMADAVGTQTETVLVRALAYGEVSPGAQLFREGTIGVLIGGTIGILAGAGLLVWDGRTSVAIVVALTLAVTAVVATLMASLLPLGLTRLGADPALASGPVATVLQDILSVAIYLSIATVILHW